MRRLSCKLSVKILTVFISIIAFLMLFALVAGIVFMAELGVYTNSFETVKTSFIDLYSLSSHDYYNDSNIILKYYNRDALDEYDKLYDNLYTIAIGDTTLASTYNGEKNYIPRTVSIDAFSESANSYLFNYDITVYYPVETPVSFEFMEAVYNMRYTLILFTFLIALIFAISLTVLFCGAGHRDVSDAITLRAVDKIPFDIHTIFLLTLAYWQLNTFFSFFYVEPVIIVLVICFVILDYLLTLNYLISFAILTKAKALIKRSLIYIIFSCMYKLIKKLFKYLFLVFSQLPLIWKTVLALLLWTALEFWIICITRYDTGILLLAWFFGRLIVFPIIIGIALLLRKIQRAGKKISEGDLEYRVDTSHMIGDFKDFGDDLNSISEGMGKAVEDKLKSERFKTELITNVSHDIKTPLTSIINYVDLIKKEHPENENIKEYIDVLERQSSRLKKLIEDLIEASKASTGNLKVTLVPCELNVLITQIAGEYEELLVRQSLSLVIDQPKRSVTISADSRHLWRVIDNLMNNIRKYSMQGTRVYINLAADNSKAYLTFRNISKSPLNISSDELMERFTRGDSSRNTEGSGLGLSISKSLTELQGGSFSLDIDGDLFKVTLIFDLIVTK